MGDDLGAAARESERTDYPRHVAQLALAHEADGGVVNVDFDWRPKNNVSNYASTEGTAMSDKSFKRHRQGRRRRRVLRAAIGSSLTPHWSVIDEQVGRLSPPQIDGPALIPDL